MTGPSCSKVIKANPVIVTMTTHMLDLQLTQDWRLQVNRPQATLTRLWRIAKGFKRRKSKGTEVPWFEQKFMFMNIKLKAMMMLSFHYKFY